MKPVWLIAFFRKIHRVAAPHLFLLKPWMNFSSARFWIPLNWWYLVLISLSAIRLPKKNQINCRGIEYNLPVFLIFRQVLPNLMIPNSSAISAINVWFLQLLTFSNPTILTTARNAEKNVKVYIFFKLYHFPCFKIFFQKHCSPRFLCHLLVFLATIFLMRNVFFDWK